MHIKTNRDVKSSLDIARKQKIPSMTSKIEETLKAELGEEFGPILTEEELSQIAQKEEERKAEQDLALKHSRMKIMKVKEKAKETQRIRQELTKGETHHHTKDFSVRANPKISGGSGKEEHSKITPLDRESRLTRFKKVNIEY